jgi:hypothetical protein
MTAFHHEISKCKRWRAGDVVRVFDGAFSDAVVLGFDAKGDALVQRAYAYASCVGTTGPTVLLGSERIVYPSLDCFEKVGEGRVS